MGQKVHPHSFRIGVIRNWESRWIVPKKEMGENIIEDYRIRNFLKKKFYACGISKIEIEKSSKKLHVFIYTAKPGIMIGRGGTEIEKVKLEISKLTDKIVALNIVEVKAPDADAQLIAENIAAQLQKRTSFRKAMKQAMTRAMRKEIGGIKVSVSGRLGGAEIARCEHYHDGRMPLQTLRADVSYGFAEANMTYGKIGVKVWLCKGEVLSTKKSTATSSKNGGNEDADAS